MTAFDATGFLSRLMDGLAGCLTPESASRVAEFHLDTDAQTRIDDLAGRYSGGELMPEELAEYEMLVNFADFIALFQSKARKLLAENPSPGRDSR